MAELESFAGFKADHFLFFRELERHNEKPWFEENRKRYESVTAAFRALLARIEPRLLKLNSNFDVAGKVNGNFSRINRDMRFARQGGPYHTNYYLYVYDRRRGRKADGRFYAGISPDGLTIGFSIYAQQKSGTLRRIFRPRLKSDLPALEQWLMDNISPRRYDCYWYRSERRKWVKIEGLPQTHDDWGRLEGLVIRKVLRPGHPGLNAPSLAHEIELTFQNLYPLYAFTSIEGRAWKKYLSDDDSARAASAD